MDILTNLLWILHFLTIVYKVKGKADGDIPQSSCQSMLVNHIAGDAMLPPQTSPMPFEVEPVITGPDLVTVTLRSNGTPFKGFMLEARNSLGNIVGKFIILEPSQTWLLNCNGLSGSAVSHSKNEEKNEFRVNWTSETEDLDVTFRATFVQRYNIFWNPVDFPITLPKPSTTPVTTKPTTLATTLSATESTTKLTDTTMSMTQATELSTTKLTDTTMIFTTSVNNFTKQNDSQIDGYVLGVTVTVIVAAPVTLIPFCLAKNAKTHTIRKWARRVGSILSFALTLSALIVLGVLEEPLNVKLIALGIVMSVTGAVTLVLAFMDIRRSHELWTLYDNVMKFLFLVQKAFAIAFIYCATKDCQDVALLYVLIAFTVWICLQIAYIIIVKILKVTDSGNKKGIEWMQESNMSLAALIITSFLNVAFCVAIIIGICQC